MQNWIHSDFVVGKLIPLRWNKDPTFYEEAISCTLKLKAGQLWFEMLGEIGSVALVQ